MKHDLNITLLVSVPSLYVLLITLSLTMPMWRWGGLLKFEPPYMHVKCGININTLLGRSREGCTILVTVSARILRVI